MLTLMPGSFVTEGERALKQIKMEEVQAHRAGLAYGRVEDVLPFLREDKSLSLDALGVLTTTRIAANQVGLLPVTNLRIPALVGDAQDPILLDGSLVNLGDLVISRHQELQPAPLDGIETSTIKLTLYRDETTLDWSYLAQSPIRAILRRFPRMVLCKGLRCGEECNKFHSPVDQELDSVIMDVWARSWHTLRGRKAPIDQAEIFHAFIRVPTTCTLPIMRLSGTDGLYAEPRQSDGKGTDASTSGFQMVLCSRPSTGPRHWSE